MAFPSTTHRYRLDYRLILELRVLHRYYTDGRCRDLDIRPTAETAAKLRGYQILFRKERDGFLLAVNGGKDYSAPLFSRPETFDFSFRVVNPQFIRFTDLPFESGQFHVFETSPQNGERMHPEEYVDGSTIQPSDVDGVTGLIRIHHGEGQPLLPADGGPDAGEPRLHHIHFDTRRVRLRYLFHGSEDLTGDCGEYFVDSFEVDKKPYIFSAPRSTKLRNGADAFEIVSLDALDLRSSYEGHGMLKKAKGSGIPFQYKRVLPLPRPENVVYDPSEGQYFTDIFVKL